jgi:DNA invertase Pin-like site-specific DNA recombinase
MKAIGYTRVSSAGQVEGFGLDAQETAVRRFAETNGMRLVRVLREEAVSGTTVAEQRPTLMRALEELTACRADALVVPSLDRLARELSIQEAALALVWQSGKRVFSADQGEILEDDPDDPMRKAMRKMRGIFAELDKDLAVARMRAGKRAAREKDPAHRTNGRAPYGYRADPEHPGSLLPVPSEQEVIAFVRKRHKQGASVRAIARELNDQGLTSRDASSWYPTQVARILARPG